MRALALGRVRDADVPGGLAGSSSAIAHQVVEWRSRSRIERISRLCGGGSQPSGAHAR